MSDLVGRLRREVARGAGADVVRRLLHELEAAEAGAPSRDDPLEPYRCGADDVEKGVYLVRYRGLARLRKKDPGSVADVTFGYLAGREFPDAEITIGDAFLVVHRRGLEDDVVQAAAETWQRRRSLKDRIVDHYNRVRELR